MRRRLGEQDGSFATFGVHPAGSPAHGRFVGYATNPDGRHPAKPQSGVFAFVRMGPASFVGEDISFQGQGFRCHYLGICPRRRHVFMERRPTLRRLLDGAGLRGAVRRSPLVCTREDEQA